MARFQIVRRPERGGGHQNVGFNLKRVDLGRHVFSSQKEKVATKRFYSLK